MSATTRRACVIGWPAKHSRSPKMHGYWIAKHGLDASYGIEEVRPEDFPAFLKTLGERGYVGANATAPHKDMALALTEPDARARAVGAANTLWFDKGVLRSTNTDVEGFIGALDFARPGWDKGAESAVVLGAGGAARAVVYGFLERGVKRIHVVNRTLEKAVAMRELFGSAIEPASWGDVPRLLAGCRLLTNATSLGLKGNPDIEIDLSPMPAGSTVADINYVPLKTGLLLKAEARGFPTSNGLDMLLYQAVRGFELWFGVRPTVTPDLRAMLAADIPER